MMWFALQEALLSPDQWHSSMQWCSPWEPEVGFKVQEVISNTKFNTNISIHNGITTKAFFSHLSCFQIAFCTFSTQHSAERCQHLFLAQPEPSARRRWRAGHGLQGLGTHWTSSHSWGMDLVTFQPWVKEWVKECRESLCVLMEVEYWRILSTKRPISLQ